MGVAKLPMKPAMEIECQLSLVMGAVEAKAVDGGAPVGVGDVLYL